MFTEEDFAGLDEERLRGVRAIFAAARGFKFSEETLRLHKLMDTDPKAAGRVILENEKRRYEKNIAPQRDAMLRQLQLQKEEDDAAASLRKQAKRQRVVASPPNMTSVGKDAGTGGHPSCSVSRKMLK
ncbi:unnamed protein product [Urochloa decumbens]|uniref:Uncharacterized protein n=1 Tax=Urochloa decumbens TaxID=240449 RepID=A0ABC9BMJ3_9POAL